MMGEGNEVRIGMPVRRADTHAIGRVQRVDASAIWVQECRLPRHTVARVVNGQVFLDAAAGRYLSVARPSGGVAERPMAEPDGFER